MLMKRAFTSRRSKLKRKILTADGNCGSKALAGSIAGFCRVLAMSAIAALGLAEARAATFYWDPGLTGGTTGVSGGGGTWALLGQGNWWNGSFDTDWNPNGTDAVFGNFAGNVFVNDIIGINSLTFNLGGYNLGGGGKLNFGSSPGLITVTSSLQTTRITTTLTGTNGFTKAGSGTLILDGDSTENGTIAGLTGGITVAGGFLILDAAAGPVNTVLNSSNALKFTNTATFQYQASQSGTLGANMRLSTLTFSGGEGTVQSSAKDALSDSLLTFSSLATPRAAGATGNFVQDSLPQVFNVTVGGAGTTLILNNTQAGKIAVGDSVTGVNIVAPVIKSGTTAAGSDTISVPNTTGLVVGMSVSGASIPGGRLITAIDTGLNTVTLGKYDTFGVLVADGAGVLAGANSLTFAATVTNITDNLNGTSTVTLTNAMTGTASLKDVTFALANKRIILTAQPAGFINQGVFFGGNNYAWNDTTPFARVRALNYGVDAGTATQGASTTGLGGIVSTTGTTTLNSNSVAVASTAGLAVGMTVNGPGIPSGEVITGIGVNSITISSGTGVTPGTNSSLSFSGHIQVTGDVTGQGNFTINTLKLNGTGPANPFVNGFVINPGATLTLSNAGILATNIGLPSAGLPRGTISGGTIAVGANELVIRVDQTSDRLVINSILTGSGGVTMSGSGSLLLNAQTTGALTFSGSATTGGSTAVQLASSTLTDPVVLTVGMPVYGPGIPANTTIASVSGSTVTLSQAATANSSFALSYSTTLDTLSTTIQLTPAQAATLTVGQIVTGAGIGPGTTIATGGINTVTGVVTLTAAPVASAPLQTVTFGGSTLAFGNTQNYNLTAGPLNDDHITATINSNQLTLPAGVPALVAGMSVSGPGIAVGTTIASVSGTTVTLSQVATASTVDALGRNVVVSYNNLQVGGGSTQVTLGAAQNGGVLLVGSLISGVNIPPNTTIANLGGGGNKVVTLSSAIPASQLYPPAVAVGSGSSTIRVGLGLSTNLFVNELITGAGIQPGTTITAINPATDTVTLSAPTTAPITTGTNISFGALGNQTLTFGGATIAFGASTLQLTAAQAATLVIGSTVTGPNIQPNTTITNIQDLGAYKIVTLSDDVTGTVSLQYLSFGGADVVGINSAYSGGTRVNSGTLSVGSAGLPAPLLVSGTSSNNSQVLTVVNPVAAGLVVGMAVSGPGIPANEFITNISGNNVTITNASGVVGGTNNLTFQFPVTVAGAAQFAALNSIIPNSVTLAGANAILSAAGGNKGGFSGAISAGPNDFQLIARDFSTFQSANLLVSGNITGSGTMEIPQISTGIVTLTGNNTAFTGPVFIRNTATLSVARLNALNGNTVTLTGTLILALDGNGAAAYNGGATAGNGTGGPQTLALNNNINLLGNGIIQPASDGTAYGGYFPSAGNKTIQLNQLSMASNVLTVRNLNGSGVQFTGPASTIGVGTLNVLTATTSNRVQGLTLSGVLSGGDTTYAQDTIIINDGTVAVGGTPLGTVVLANSANTFGGNGSIINIKGGVLSVAADGALGNSLNSISLNNTASAALRATGTFSTGRQIALNASSGNTLEVTAGNTLTLTSQFILPPTNEAYPLFKGDNGTLVIQANNTTTIAATGTALGTSPWSGPLTINAGTVRVLNGNALGTSGIGGLTGGVTVARTGAALQLSGGANVTSRLRLNGTGIGTAGALQSSGSVANTASGQMILATASTIGADAGSTLNLTGGITGLGGVALTLNSAGTINITTKALDTAYTVTGDTGNASLTITGVPDTSNILVGQGIKGPNIRPGTLVTATTPGPGGTITLSQTTNNSAGSGSYVTQGSISLVKLGAGTATLSVDSPSYIGAITVNQGNFAISGTGVTIGTPAAANNTTVQGPSGVLTVNDALGAPTVHMGGSILTSIIVSNTTTINVGAAAAAGLVTTQQVFGANIPANTTITGIAVDGNGDPTGVLTLSAATTGAGATQTVNFGSNRNLALTGGTLIVNGNAAGTTEIFGALTSARNATNVIQSNPSGGNPITLFFPSLTINGDSTLDFRGTGLGNGTNKISFYNAAPGTTNLLLQRATVNSSAFAAYNSIGGLTVTTNAVNATITLAPGQDTSFLSTGQAVTGTGIPANTTIASIVANTSITLSNQPAAGTVFLTFGNSNGIQAMTSFNTTNTFPNATTTSADTYSFTANPSATFTVPQTINAFKVTGNIAVGDNGLPGNSLTLTSAAILSPTGNNSVNFKVVSFGTQAFVSVGSGTTLTIGSLLTGGNGLIKALPGTLQFNNPTNSAGYANLSAQTLTGNFTIGAGTVILKANQNNTLTPNQFLILGPGATLDLNGTSQFALGTRGDAAALQGNAGTFTNTSASQAALILGTDSGGFTFGGVITQGAGNGATSFFKGSSFGYNLSNASPYLGATVLAGGSNVLQDGGSIANTSSVDLNYARLTLNDNNINASSVALTGTTTLNSALVTVPSTSGLSVGMSVSGTGIPAGEFIAAISTNQIALTTGSLVQAGTNALTFSFNRVNPTAPISMRGGSLAYTGRAQTEGTQKLGAVTLFEGANTIQVVNGGTGVNSATLALTSLARSANSAATIQFPDNGTLGTLGNSANVTFSTLNGTNTVAAVAGNNNLLGPWAVVGREFASYIPTLGVGALNQTGFAGYSTNYLNLQPLSTDNIRATLSVPGLTTDTTVNTLAVNTLTANANAAVTVDLGGKKLTLLGGGLILAANNTNAAINQNITIQNGTLTSGALNVGGDLYVHALNYGGVNNTFILSANITNNGSGIVRLVEDSAAVDAATDFLMVAGTSLNFGGSLVVGASTTAGSNTVNVASVTGISIGMSVSGVGLPAGEVVTGISGNTVTLSTGTGVTTTGTNNTYSGGTVINGGTMLVGPGGNIPAGGITIGGGEVTGIGSLTQLAGGVIAPTNTVTVNGLGALLLTGNNTLAGLVFNGNGAGSTGSTTPPPPTVTTFNSLTPIGTGTLTLGGGGITSTPLDPAAIATVAGRLDFGAAASPVTVNAYNLATNVSNFVFTDFAPTTAGLILQGVTGSGGGINKAGAGVLQFNAQDVFTGPLNVTAGTVQIGAANAGSRFSQLNLSSPTSRLNLNGQSTVLGSLAGNGIITNTLGSQTLTVGFDNSDSQFSGQISRFNDATPSAVTLVKIGAGTLTISSAQSSTTGSSGGVTVSGGGLTYSNAGAAYPSTALTGVTYTVNTGGTLTLDNTAVNLVSRLGLDSSVGTLTLAGGTLAMIANNAGSSETLNLLNFSNGGSTIRLTRGAAGATTIFVTGAFSNQGGQDSGLVTGLGLGGTGAGSVNVNVGSGGFVGFGGGGGADSETMSIRPDLLGDAAGGSGTGFLARDPSTGNLRPLNTTTELTADMGQASLNNNNNSNVGLTASNNALTNRIVTNQTVNSLTLVNRVVSPNTIPDTGVPSLGSGLGVAAGAFAANGAPLTLTSLSGGFLALSSAAINIGAITSGGVTGDYHVVGGATILTLNGSIVSTTNGIVKADDGTLVFNARQYYTGSAGNNGTTVNGGTLQLNAGNNTVLVQPTGNIPTVLGLFLNGGTLDLNGTSQAVERITNNNPNTGAGGTVINSAGNGTTFVTLTSATGTSTTFAGSIGTGLLTPAGNAIHFSNSGNITLTLVGVSTYTGSTTIRGGNLTLQNSGVLAQTSSVTVNFGTLVFNEAGLNPAGANPTRTPVAAPLTLNGGTLQQNSGGSLDSTATLNTVILGSGASTITQSVTQNTGSSAQINIGTLVQQAGAGTGPATVNIASANGVLGGGGLNNNQLLINFITPSGGSTATPASLLSNGMLPAWITVNGGTNFAGYLTSPAGGSRGVGALSTANYPGYAAPVIPFSTALMANTQIPANGNSSFNISATATVLPVSARLVNSLKITGTTTIPLNLTTDTFSIGTGGLLVASGTGIVQGGRLTAGTLANNPGVLYATATAALTINSQIVNNGNQVFSANTDGISNIVTVSSTAGLVAGQQLSGPGIPGGATIQSIINGTSFTIGTNTSAVSFLVNDIKKVNTATSAGSNAVTVVAGGTALAVGMYVTGPAVPAGTVVTALGTPAAPNTITLSNAPTRTMSQQAYFTTVGNNNPNITLSNAQASVLTIGMAVTGTNVPLNTTIANITPGATNSVVTLSNNATGTASTQLLSFGATLNFARLGNNVAMLTNTTASTVGTAVNTSTGAPLGVVTSVLVNNNTGLAAGMPVSGPGIPAGTVIGGFGGVTIGAGAVATFNTVPNSTTVQLLAPPANSFSLSSASAVDLVFGTGLSVGNGTTGAVSLVKTGGSTLTLTPQIVLNGSLNGTANVVLPTNAAGAGLLAGMTVSGAGIPLGTTILSTNGSTLVLSNAATVTSTSVSLSQLSYGPGTAVVPGLATTSAFSNTYTGANQITLAANTYAAGTAVPLTFGTSGQIINTSNVTINGSGTFSLFGANTLGSITINNTGGSSAPTVALGTSGVLTLTNGITVVNDNLSFTPIVSGTNSTLLLPVTASINTSGISPDGLLITAPIVPSGALVKTGPGALILTPTIGQTTNTTAATATFAVVNTAGLSVGMGVSGTGIPAGRSIASISGNTITLTSGIGVTTAANTALTFSGNTFSGGVNLNGGSLILTQNTNQFTTVAPTIAVTNATINLPSTAGLAVGMAVSGTGIPAGEFITAINPNVSITLTTATGITAQTNSTLTFAGANTVLAGPAGSGPLNMANDTALLSDGTLRIIGNAVNIAANATFGPLAGGGTALAGNGLTLTGPVTLLGGGAHTITVPDLQNTTTISGQLSGGNNPIITKAGTGTLVLSNPAAAGTLPANTFTGTTTFNIAAGVLRLGAAAVVPAGLNLSVSPGAVYDINNQAGQVLSTLTGGGMVTNSAGTQTLFVGGTSTTDVANSFAASFDGILTAPNTGTFASPTYPGLVVTKVGLGTQTLTGANLYSGATNILAGKLLVNGSLANTPVIVGSGATAASLGGTGTIGNGLLVGGSGVNVAVNSVGTLDLTNGSLGNLTINPFSSATGLTIASGANLKFDIGSVSTDQIVINNGGKILFASGTATVSFTQLAGGALQNGIYTLISYNANTGSAGTFTLGTGAPSGSTLQFNPGSLTLNVGGVVQNFFWTGAKGSAGTGVWFTATPASGTNWNTLQTGGADTLQIPNTTAIVNFNATGGTNVNTTLGSAFTISQLNFLSTSTSDVTISDGAGGPFALTLNSGINMNAGTANVTISNGSLILGSPQSWTISTTVASPGKNLTVNAPLTGTSGLTISAPGSATGKVILNGNNSNFTGGITVAGNGTNVALQLGSATALGPVAGPNPLIVASGALDMFGNSATVSSLSSTLTTAGTGIIKNTSAGTTSTLNVVQNSATTTIFSGAIQDGPSSAKVALVVDGGGTLQLTTPVGTNLSTFTGGTTINGATLRMGSNGNEIQSSLGTGLVTINSGGTLNFSPGNVATTFFIANSITLNGGEIRSSGGNQRLANNGVSTLGTINVIAPSTITPSPTGSQDVFVDGTLTGSAALTVGGTGSGKVILTNNANTYSGTLTSTASGNLQLARVSAPTTDSLSLRFADLFLSTNANGFTFGSTVTTATLGSLAGGGNFALQNTNATPAAVTLTVGNNGNGSNYTGIISNSAATIPGSLIKTGAGTFTLGNGAANYGPNTYRGATTVNAGAFLVNSAHPTASVTGLGNVFVTGTATLGGNGVIQGGDNVSPGVITLAGGTFLDPGLTAGSFGTLRFGVQVAAAQNATLTLQASSTLKFDVGTGAGSQDRVLIIGNAAIAGSKLVIGAPSTPDQGNYTILSTTTGVSGTFTGGITNPLSNYSVVYSANTVDLQRFSTIGSVSTPAGLQVIKGASVPFFITVPNSAPSGSADLSFYATSIPASNTTGSVASPGSPIVVTAGSTNPAPGAAGLSFSSAAIAVAGPGKTGNFTVNATGANVTNPTLAGTVTVDVLDHATFGAFAGGTLTMQPVRVGYVGPITSTNSLNVTNGSVSDFRVNLGGSVPAPIGNLSINSLFGVAPGATGNITASLASGQPQGTFSQAFTYSLGDDSTLNGTNNGALGTVPITVQGNIYNGQGVWGATGGGVWSTFSQWTMPGGYPGIDGAASINDTASFGSNLGTGTVALNTVSPLLSAMTFTSTSGTIAQGTGSGSVTLQNNQSLVAPTVTVTGAGGTPTISAPVVLTNTATVNTVGAANTMTLSGPISGPGGLTKTGPGTAFVTNTNTYLGKTAVNGGILSVPGASSLGQDPGGIGVSDQISVDNGGTLAFTGDATLSSTQGFTVGSGNGTVDVAANKTVVMSAPISGTLTGTATKTGTLTKTGAGTLNIRNSIQSDILLTTVPSFALNAGTLSIVSGPWAAGVRATSDIHTGNVSFNGGTSTLAINVQGTAGASALFGNDRLTADNRTDAIANPPQVPSLQITATTKLTIDFGTFVPSVGDSFIFLSDATRQTGQNYTNFFQVGNTLAAPGVTFSAGSGGYFQIDYTGAGNFNDIILLAVVPEPGTATLLLGGVGLLGLMRRRRARNLPFGS